MAVHNILNGGGNQKILLTQTQTLALGVIIRRVKHLADNFRHCILLHGTQIFPLVEHIHIQTGRLCTPKAEDTRSVALVA